MAHSVGFGLSSLLNGGESSVAVILAVGAIELTVDYDELRAGPMSLKYHYGSGTRQEF